MEKVIACFAMVGLLTGTVAVDQVQSFYRAVVEE